MMHNRGQSETVGNALLIGIVVLVVTTATVGILFDIPGGGPREEGESTQQIDLQPSVTGANLTLTHAGGDSINGGEMLVVISNGSAERRFSIEKKYLSGNDGTFDPGETFTRAHNLTGKNIDITVAVQGAKSGTVPLDTTLPIPTDPATLGQPVWNSSADWDNAARSVAVVHDGFASHNASKVALGHPRGQSNLVGYWPFDEDSGPDVGDVSGNDNNGTADGATVGASGVANTTAYQFGDGNVVRVDDSASLSQISNSDTFSVSGWVQTTDSQTAPLWSRFDRFGPDSAGDDVFVGLDNGRFATLVGEDGTLSRNHTVETESDYNEGMLNETVVREGDLELERRDVRYGNFTAPSSTGTEYVDVGFEPDMIVFQTAIIESSFGDRTNVGGRPIGTGTGFVDCTDGSCTQRARSFGSGSSSPNGQRSVANESAIHQVVTGSDGTGLVGTVSASVTDTNLSGFTLDYDQVAGGGFVKVTYRAYTFAPESNVSVGHFRTPDASAPTPTGTQEHDIGFQPNSVRLLSGPQMSDSVDVDSDNGEEFGWTRGWAVRNESKDVSKRATAVGETGRFETATTNTTFGEIGNFTTPSKTMTLGESGTFTPSTETVDLGESGSVTVSNGNWKTINFNDTYSDPVVVGTTNTKTDGEHALSFDAKDVEESSAKIRVCESEGAGSDSCDSHGQERVGYIVINATAADEVPGIEAGTVDIDQGIDARRDTVTLSSAFGSSPVVMANVQNTSGDQPVETRVTSTSSTQFRAGICHQGGSDNCDNSYGTRTVGWVAVDPSEDVFEQKSNSGVETGIRSSNWADPSFSASFSEGPTVVVSTLSENGGQEVQIDEAKSVTTGGADVRYCEMESGNSCDGHTGEDVGWLAVERGTDLTATVTTPEWTNVSFSNSYANPVVVGTTNSKNDDGSALTFDARNVRKDSAEMRVCEASGGTTDGCTAHDPETVGYVIVNASAADEVPGIEAGTVDLDQGIDARRDTVALSETYDSSALVLANTQTADGDQPVEARVTSTSRTQFRAGICHQDGFDSCDSSHGTETVGWVAIDPTVDVFDDGETGVESVANSNWESPSFSSFSSAPVVVASTQSENDGSELQIDEARNVTAGGADVRYCEMETGESCDTSHASESVGWLAVERGTDLTATFTGGTWKNVSFTNSYTDPVVIGTANTHDGDPALTFDARNVREESAEMRVCELNGATTDGCVAHGPETVGYAVIDAANTSKVSGIDAGTLEEGGDFSFDTNNHSQVSYNEEFNNRPVVLANVQTTNGDQPVETRIKERNKNRFTVGICHYAGGDVCDDSRTNESIGWVAIDDAAFPLSGTVETGETGAVVGSSNWRNQTFENDYENPPAVVASTMTENGGEEVKVDEANNVTNHGVDVRYCELDDRDTCDGHNAENVGWLAAPNQTTLSVETGAGEWKTISFDNTYENPVVVGTTNTHNGTPALTFDAQNVQSDSAEMRVCEIDGTADDCDNHVSEEVGYVVVDAAKTDGMRGLAAGTVSTGGSFSANNHTDVYYGQSFDTEPVVLANTQTTRGSGPAETRIENRDSNRFSVGICHLESTNGCDDDRTAEEIGWVAIEPGNEPFNETVEADELAAGGSGQWNDVTYNSPYSSRPVVLASTMTGSSEEVLVDEINNVTTSDADVRFCEADAGTENCDSSPAKTVGWVALPNSTTLNVTWTPRHEQLAFSASAAANDINDHNYASSDRRILNTLWADESGDRDIDGRIRAYLESFDNDGFTLNYTTNNPDSDDDRFLVTYLAVNSTVPPELGHGRTPESTGTQTYETNTSLSEVELFGVNAIPAVGTEAYSGNNEPDNHLGWMVGGGRIDQTDGQATGFSSHSSSVNQHAVASRTNRPFEVTYADQNGQVLGSDVAAFDGTSGEQFTLDWTETTTTSDDSKVRFDRTAFVWHSYGGNMGVVPKGEFKETVTAQRPVYWGAVERNETVPSGTQTSVDYSDGKNWYDNLEDVPKTDTLTYNITLSQSVGDETPSISDIRTEYRNYILEPLWKTEEMADWEEGTVNQTTVSGERLQQANGSLGEAGTVTTSDGTWQTIQFEESYTTPIVVGTTNTKNDPNQHALTFDARNVQSDSAEVRVCESEGGAGNGCDTHTSETVGYVVVDAARANQVAGIEAGSLSVDGGVDPQSGRETVSYSGSYGTTPVVLANVQTTDDTQPVETRVTNTNTGEFNVAICHQTGTDGCNNSRSSETVGWVALEPGNLPFLGSAEVGATGDGVGGSSWEDVSFSEFDDSPVVVASTQTEDGGQELQIDEVKDVSAGDADVRYCELENFDGCDSHTGENIGWFAVEPGPLEAIDRYEKTGEYERTLELDRDVDWQESELVTTEPSGTDVYVNYSTDGTVYDSLSAVPDSDELTYNLTLTGPGDKTPTVDKVNISYEAIAWRNGTTTVDDGSYHYLTATYDGSALRLYVDGTLDATHKFETDIESSTSDWEFGDEMNASWNFDGKLDSPRLFSEARTASAIGEAANVDSNGLLVTDERSFERKVPPGSLKLQNFTATIPAGTNVTIVVESDPDEDGNYEDTSKPITFAGNANYDVKGLNVESRIYRLRVKLTTTNPTNGPTFSGAALTTDAI